MAWYYGFARRHEGTKRSNFLLRCAISPICSLKFILNGQLQLALQAKHDFFVPSCLRANQNIVAVQA
jgi:hypothetical protein